MPKWVHLQALPVDFQQCRPIRQISIQVPPCGHFAHTSRGAPPIAHDTRFQLPISGKPVVVADPHHRMRKLCHDPIIHTPDDTDSRTNIGLQFVHQSCCSCCLRQERYVGSRSAVLCRLSPYHERDTGNGSNTIVDSVVAAKPGRI